MCNFAKTACVSAVVASFGLSTSLPARAAEEGSGDDQALEQRVENLERNLDMVKREARAEERAQTKWHLAGYADVGFVSSNEEGPEDSFEVGRFNPGFHWLYQDILMFESELEFALEDGETETSMEYADLNFYVNDRLTLVAGKFLSPVGQFQERLHPSWINKLPDAPAGFGHGGAQPLSEVGVQARGGVPFGDSVLTYAVAVGNGPRLGDHGPELEGFEEDNNSNKAVSGRLGFLPVPNLEVGASLLTGTAGEGAGPAEADLDLWGLDAAYTAGPWSVRAEYLNSELAGELGGEEGEHAALRLAEEAIEEVGHDEEEGIATETEFEAWYVQIARRFGDWEPVARYSEFTVEGNPEFGEDARSEWSAGLNYILAPSAIAKVAYQSVDPDHGEEYERVLVQFSYGF